MKTLIVYYSHSGNTAQIARRAGEALGCDVAEVKTAVPYQGDYNAVVDQGKREVEAGFCPEIQPLGVDLSAYERIVLGTPVWWYTMAPALRTVLTQNDMAGKTLVPLVTSGGWPGHTEKDMAALCPQAAVEGGIRLTFSGQRMTTPEETVEKWLEGLKKAP